LDDKIRQSIYSPWSSSVGKSTKVILTVLGLVLILFSSFIAWAETPLGPLEEVNQALKSDPLVDVSMDKWLTFSPQDFQGNTGFIIYPGGRVDYRSYAPIAHAISARGYKVVVLPMPFNLAVFGVDKAIKVINANPEIKAWAIGGHSLGGTMAAQFAYNNPSEVQGLVLWAAYPASGDDFSGMPTSVVTIHGSNDGLVSASQIDGSMKILPGNTVRVEIQGGNHAQFGSYGKQPGDKDATISRESQQAQVVEATAQLLNSIAAK
jgi:dienelactone hydrolase